MPYSPMILADSDGTNVLFFEGDLGQPWPEYPEITYERVVSAHRMIPGWSSGAVPGRRVVIDSGFHSSTGDVEIFLPYVDEDMHEDLMDKYETVDKLLWSRDGGITIYLVAWQDGKSYEPSPHPGFPGKRTAKLKFHILQIYGGGLFS